MSYLDDIREERRKELAPLAALLEQAARKEIPVERLESEAPYDGCFGTWKYRVGGWTFGVFFDCGAFDYVDMAVSPEGKAFGYHEMNSLPLLLLDENGLESLELLDGLEAVLYAAPGATVAA